MDKMSTWHMPGGAFVREMTNNASDSQKQLGKMTTDHKIIFNILAKLKELREEKKLCDLMFQIGKCSYPAHKTVIAAWSSVLANLILSQQDKKADHVIYVHYDNTGVFSDFLDYCYSGLIIITELNVYSLLDIGKNLLVNSLVDSCEAYLKSTVSHSNFVSRFITSVKYSLKSLEESLIVYIETNLASLVSQDELLNLRPQDLHIFLTSGKMLEIKTEVKLSFIINWVNFCPVERNQLLLYLLSQLTWDHSVGDLLIQISCTENLFTSNEVCLFQLLQCLVNSTGHHLGPFMTAYPRLYSIYSHMIDELTLPKVFSDSVSRIQDIVSIPVSIVMSQPHTQALRKDAEVNTDVDSTYFSEPGVPTPQLEIPQEQTDDAAVTDTTTTSTAADVENVVTENSQADLMELNPVEDSLSQNFRQEKYDDLVEEPSSVDRNKNKNKSNKHRRKGNPRKIDLKETDTKPKKGKGKAKKGKAIGKNEKNKTPVDVNKGKNKKGKGYKDTDQENNLTPVLSENVNRNEIETSNMVLENLENGDHAKVDVNETEDERPKIKLSLKVKKLKQTKSSAKQAKRKTKKTDEMGFESVEKLIRKFRCEYEGCTYSTKSGSQLQKHVECIHLTKVHLQCQKCEYSTNQMKDYCLHMKTHYDQVPYPCEEPGCNQKFIRICLLVRHQLTHRTDKPYKCDQPLCTKSFACMGQLRCHRKLHEGRQFSCDICHKLFTTKGVMQQHRVIHFKNKSYLCDTCGFSTKHQSHLISHRKVHSGDVLHCTFPKCNYTTPKQGHMTQHMNTHLNIRNHICQVCGKSFVVRSKLLRHERIHLKEKLYKCKQCDYQTSRTDRMKLHIESHGIKFKRKKWNTSYDQDVEAEQDTIDFHQLYERMHPDDNSLVPIQNLTDISMVSVAEMKAIDTISLAASASMIVDGYPTSKLMMDPITGEAVTSIEDALTFQQSFERIHTAGFDQL